MSDDGVRRSANDAGADAPESQDQPNPDDPGLVIVDASDLDKVPLAGDPPTSPVTVVDAPTDAAPAAAAAEHAGPSEPPDPSEAGVEPGGADAPGTGSTGGTNGDGPPSSGPTAPTPPEADGNGAEDAAGAAEPTPAAATDPATGAASGPATGPKAGTGTSTASNGGTSTDDEPPTGDAPATGDDPSGGTADGTGPVDATPAAAGAAPSAETAPSAEAASSAETAPESGGRSTSGSGSDATIEATGADAGPGEAKATIDATTAAETVKAAGAADETVNGAGQATETAKADASPAETVNQAGQATETAKADASPAETVNQADQPAETVKAAASPTIPAVTGMMKAIDPSGGGGRKGWKIAAGVVGAAIGAYLLLAAAWAFDMARHNDAAMRGLRFADRPIGGMVRSEMETVVGDLTDELAGRPLTVSVGDVEVETDPINLGLRLDDGRMIDHALRARRDGSLPLRPFRWLGHLFSEEVIDPIYIVDAEAATDAATDVIGVELARPVEPKFDVRGAELVVLPGEDGVRVEPRELVGRLPVAVAGGAPYRLELAEEPALSQLRTPDLEELATEINRQTAEPVLIQVLDDQAEVSPRMMKSWIRLDVGTGAGAGASTGDDDSAADGGPNDGTDGDPTEDEPAEDEPTEETPTEDEPTEETPTEDEPTEDDPTDRGDGAAGAPSGASVENPGWRLDEDAMLADLKPLFPTLGSENQQATFSVVDDEPIIIPAAETVICCEEGSGDRMERAIREAIPVPGDEEEAESVEEGEAAGRRVARLAPIVTDFDEGVAELESLGIVELVSTFETKHACCQNRVKNIQRFADLMQGVIIRPGETFSLNGHVGQRTREKGFFADGAIAQGVIEPQVGGGISQYATTFFNASFFAGLEFVEYQSHSIYISRYPRGREATISWRKPDLKVKNTTDYGILVWNDYTPTSIEVSFYSTKHLDVQALDLRRSSDRQCRIDITPRVITHPDGTQVEDSVFALYRPGEGFDCNGNSTRPEEDEE